MHRFKLNMNGNEGIDLRDQFINLHRLAMDLRAHMGRMDHIHGRNYQTLPHAEMAQQADVAEYREKLAQIDGLIEYAMSGTARVIKQREGL